MGATLLGRLGCTGNGLLVALDGDERKGAAGANRRGHSGRELSLGRRADGGEA
jgi:hypothetical protein